MLLKLNHERRATLIIGFAGAKRSGKDSAAKILQTEFGSQKEIYKHSFAHKLKESAAACLDIPTDEEFTPEMWSDTMKENGVIDITWGDYENGVGPRGFKRITGREYLQKYGTEAHRNIFGHDFWIDAVLDKIPDNSEYEQEIGYYSRLDLITDVRFSNEAEAILDRDGMVVQIRRSSVESDNPEHASEVPLRDALVSQVIMNDKDLETYRTNLLSFFINEVML